MISQQEFNELDIIGFSNLTPTQLEYYIEFLKHALDEASDHSHCEAQIEKVEQAEKDLETQIDNAIDELKDLQKQYPDELAIDEIISTLQY